MSFLPAAKPNGEVFHGHPVFELDGVRAIILASEELASLTQAVDRDALHAATRYAVSELGHISDKYFPAIDWSIHSLSFRRYLDGVWIVVRSPHYKDADGVWRAKPALEIGVTP